MYIRLCVKNVRTELSSFLSKDISFHLSLSDKFPSYTGYIIRPGSILERGCGMYHELYIDVFFLENLMMDSLLLFALDHILKCGRTKGRLFLCGALGSFLTCVVIAVPFPEIVKLFLFHAVINSIMIVLGLKVDCAAQFVRAYVLLYATSVVLGGIMTLFRPYMRYTSLFYCAALAAYFLLLRLWKVISYLAGRQHDIVQVTLCTERGEVSAKALWDTGNRLRDFVTGSPVNVIDPELLGRMTDHVEGEKGFHMIPYRSVGGERIMKVFRIRKMCVHTETDRWISEPVIGVAQERVSAGNEYEMILNPGIFCD